MKPLSSRTRALFLGISLFLTLNLAACGGGKVDAQPTESALVTTPAPVVTTLAPVIRCAP
ncbi:hypothetical protein [Polaromonas sp. UBA4122]|uniref:hypothetical protein n=1 Tax=Polaromonas sp. UBA4122 TaxID=1947074 RepID=UPI0025CC7ECE|nr:hypothetical protein [Polaromonas sp. UBA4122]